MPTIAPTIPTSQREILVNLGNRYAVFGPRGLPARPRFSPEADSADLPLVDDEPEAVEARIIQTLRVDGMRRTPAPEDATNADIELVDEAGNHIQIELRVRERDPKGRDNDQAIELLTEASREGRALELWHFNIERLKLVIMRLDELHVLRADELSPLDVWQKTSEVVYDRARVIEEVDDWVLRVDSLYEDVRNWLQGVRPDLQFEQDRAVTLYEQTMQQFAVPERDISILDVLEKGEVVLTFLPRGLWWFRAWGRVDIIARERTEVLLAVGGPGNPDWQLVLAGTPQRRVPFDREALLTIVSQP